FAESYKKGLIYKDYRVNPYCYRCQTPLSISDARSDDSTRPKQDRTITAKIQVVGVENTFFLIWTTTPWTLPSNLAIAAGKEITYAFVKVANGETYILAKDLIKDYVAEIGKDFQITKELSGAELVKLNLSYKP